MSQGYNYRCCSASSGRRIAKRLGIAARISRSLALSGCLLGLVSTFASAAPQQDESKRKIPVIDKITSTTGQEAFSGLVQSLDLKNSVLQVHSTRDDTDEYFPFKKNVHVANSRGDRLTLDGVKEGTSVLVYYEQKGDKRNIKEIVVLGPGAADTGKGKAAPPS